MSTTSKIMKVRTSERMKVVDLKKKKCYSFTHRRDVMNLTKCSVSDASYHLNNTSEGTLFGRYKLSYEQPHLNNYDDQSVFPLLTSHMKKYLPNKNEKEVEDVVYSCVARFMIAKFPRSVFEKHPREYHRWVRQMNRAEELDLELRDAMGVV